MDAALNDQRQNNFLSLHFPLNFDEMGDSVCGSFVSHKVSKIRWKPEVMDDSEYFITGSSDEESNFLTLWFYPLIDTDYEDLPVKKATLAHEGDVTGLEFLDSGTAVCASSLGAVQLLTCTQDALSVHRDWGKLHEVCTDVTCFDEDIASVGEEGAISLLTLSQTQPVRTLDSADSSPIMCVSFLKHNELVTGNFRGQLKLWDLRSPDDVPLSSFAGSGEGGAGGCVTCVTSHPTQRHLMLAGGQDGAVTVWDLRRSTFPVNVLNAHTATVSEIKFHPERPEHLLTCSWSGDVWQWNTSTHRHRNMRDDGEEVPWLSSDATKHRLEISSLMPPASKPVNSLDVNRTRLICGSDNEAVYLVKNLQL